MSQTINDQVYWSAVPSESGATDEWPSVYLLPGYDEYLLGYKDRNAVLKAEKAHLIVPGNNGVFMPIVVIDGQVAGIWKRTIKNKGIDIEISLFVPRNDRKESLIDAAGQYCAFLGLALASTSIQVLK